jgi:general secretion pathway protein J
MARELSMAFVSTHLNPDPNLQTVQTAFVGQDHLGSDRIDFTSFSHRRLYRNAHESDQNSISYFVTNHPDDSAVKVLARREQSRIDDEPRKGGKSQILVEGVHEFEIDYFDPLISQWVKSWDTTQMTGQPNRLPAQVRIKLTVEDPRRPGRTQDFGTRVSIPITFALNHANYNP